MRDQFPFVPPELVKALVEAFPDKLPTDPTLTQAEFAALVGQQTVIRFLKHKLLLQEQPHRSI